MHPLKRRYEPVLLDRYPPKTMVDEMQKRNPFPDYVPMFAFPNDVNVVSSDERPRSTWHGFAMTNADGSKIYGINLIIWLPLNRKAAEELERCCEEWRKANMSPEERELAGSLGERLAIERAKLSRLLARLPTMEQGSLERDNLEEEIGAVEEKIGLMADLLRPVRHGAASKIEGLTDGETGLWIPRAYGVLGKDVAMTSFWKEWLRAVAVPMTNGGVLRVPPSSPKVGMWQPLERYVVNLCAEALSPISSITQVEINIRELRLYARKEACNEIPLSRNTDLYALFRCLSIPNIVVLFEYVLAESRIILLSSHAAMLHLASAAIASLLYPLKWSGVFIPVLPARLVQAIEAPCPYIVGIERRYENVEFPEDDFVLVDLDDDLIESTGPPASLPRQQRRKLASLLNVAAPHHNRAGVPTGPPAYAIEAYPNDAFASEHPSIYTHRAPASQLATLVSLNSAQFGSIDNLNSFRAPIFNGFLQARNDQSRGSEPQRPATSSTGSNSRMASPPSPKVSPISGHFPVPGTPMSRSDSGLALQQNLREKRSGLFDSASRRSSSFGFERSPIIRRPSQPFLGHIPTPSTSTLGSEFKSGSCYAPSLYAQSTLAASTIMPNFMNAQPRNTENTQWVEGHCMRWNPHDERSTCTVCEERADEGVFRCSGCSVTSHGRCLQQIALVCPTAFRPDQIRAAFARCFASLFYTYRRFLQPANKEQKKNGMKYKFNMEGFLKSIPHEQADYIQMLQETQAFNEFIHERETIEPSVPEIRLFDQIIVSKKNRGHRSWIRKGSEC
jgi:DENN (AEX-3) domain/uDENN domain/dDENN domain